MLKRIRRAANLPNQQQRGSYSGLTDADLVRRSLLGDSEAFRTLVERYQRAVYVLAFSILANREDAQDLAQETFLAAYRRLPQLRDQDKFAGWLFGTTRHLCYVLLRRRRVVGEQISVEEAEPFTAPSTTGSEDGRLPMIQEVLESLPEKYQVLLRLKYMGGYSYRQIAEMTDIPEITVKSRLFEGRRMLRERVALLVRKYDET